MISPFASHNNYQDIMMDTTNCMKMAEKIFGEAEQYTWGLREGNSIEVTVLVFNEQIRKEQNSRTFFQKLIFPRIEFGLRSGETSNREGSLSTTFQQPYLLNEKEAICCAFASLRQNGFCGLLWKRSNIPTGSKRTVSILVGKRKAT